MATWPASGTARATAVYLLGLLLLVPIPSSRAQGYTPLPAQGGSSGFFSDELSARLSLTYGPQGAALEPGRILSADAHARVNGYGRRSCENCHTEQGGSLHAVRAGLACRQCHGADPIGFIQHYYSAMNPIRRHAYVCAKCHEGASASFATYVVHTPANARASETLLKFPALYWTDWLMFALIVGVFLVFLPHSIGWWLREWFVKRKSES